MMKSAPSGITGIKVRKPTTAARFNEQLQDSTNTQRSASAPPSRYDAGQQGSRLGVNSVGISGGRLGGGESQPRQFSGPEKTPTGAIPLATARPPTTIDTTIGPPTGIHPANPPGGVNQGRWSQGGEQHTRVGDQFKAQFGQGSWSQGGQLWNHSTFVPGGPLTALPDSDGGLVQAAPPAPPAPALPPATAAPDNGPSTVAEAAPPAGAYANEFQNADGTPIGGAGQGLSAGSHLTAPGAGPAAPLPQSGGTQASALVAEGANTTNDQGRIAVGATGQPQARVTPQGEAPGNGEVAINSADGQQEIWRRDQVVQRLIDRWGPRLGATDEERRATAEAIVDLLAARPNGQDSRWWLRWEDGSVYDTTDTLWTADDEANLASGQYDPDFASALNEQRAGNARRQAAAAGPPPPDKSGNIEQDFARLTKWLTEEPPLESQGLIDDVIRTSNQENALNMSDVFRSTLEGGARAGADPGMVQGRMNQASQRSAATQAAQGALLRLQSAARDQQTRMQWYGWRLQVAMVEAQSAQDDRVRKQMQDYTLQLQDKAAAAQMAFMQLQAEMSKPKWWQIALGMVGGVVGAGLGSLAGGFGSALGGYFGGRLGGFAGGAVQPSTGGQWGPNTGWYRSGDGSMQSVFQTGGW